MNTSVALSSLLRNYARVLTAYWIFSEWPADIPDLEMNLLFPLTLLPNFLNSITITLPSTMLINRYLRVIPRDFSPSVPILRLEILLFWFFLKSVLYSHLLCHYISSASHLPYFPWIMTKTLEIFETWFFSSSFHPSNPVSSLPPELS